MLEERADLAREEVGDGLGCDLQGQRVARVRLDQARPFLRGAHDLLVREQLLAGVWLQPGESQGAHRGALALQRHQVGWFLPAGQQQATLVCRFAHTAQHVPKTFVAGAIVPPALSCLQQGFQVVQHQQRPPHP